MRRTSHFSRSRLPLLLVPMVIGGVLGPAASAGADAVPVNSYSASGATSGSVDVRLSSMSVESATNARRQAEQHLADASAALAAHEAKLANEFAHAAELANEIEKARGDVRRAAVAAFVDGGDNDPMVQILAGVDAAEVSGRASFLAGRAVDASDAVARFEQLKQASDPRLVSLAEQRDALASRVADADDAATQARAQEADAERAEAARIAAAEAAARADAAREAARQQQEAAAKLASKKPASAAANATGSGAGASPAGPGGPTGSPSASAVAPPKPPQPSAPSSGGVVVATEFSAPLPVVPPGGPSEEAWAALRRCESGGNYRAVSRSGLYRGAYQFDTRTWQSLGGRGDPAGALPEEQDARARLLYSQRGARPWPVCGRGLNASVTVPS